MLTSQETLGPTQLILSPVELSVTSSRTPAHCRRAGHIIGSHCRSIQKDVVRVTAVVVSLLNRYHRNLHNYED
jgi:hypothetical protein